jgi:hypothetical protein
MTPITTSPTSVVIGSNQTIMILVDLVTLKIIVPTPNSTRNSTSSKVKTPDLDSSTHGLSLTC